MTEPDDGLHLSPVERWAELEALQEAYPDTPEGFGNLLYDVIVDLLGFNCTWLQLDIGAFLADRTHRYKMIQAQRGQAKTTITAVYAVFRMIHDPTTRVLIISSGSDMATEISNWVIQIIYGMEELRCLRPDRSAGDRCSVKAFDVHHELKGPEKSPSLACIGITSNMQGKRADLLIADDVESSKNSQTEVQRERLKHLTLDFTSICSKGDIIYLGTPQSIDSVYNGLPGRGYLIRIWPGRYPTKDEEKNYGPHLAPSIIARMAADPALRIGGGPTGDRGKPTDPILLDEETLTKKEIDQGKAYFQLQHMLDTRLADEDRFPLKSRRIIFMHIPATRAPVQIDHVASEEHRIYPPQGFPVAESYYRAARFADEFGDFVSTHMYVDPAGGGQNGDETAYAVTKFLAGRVFLVDVGGVAGGLHEESLNALTDIAVKWKPKQIDVEENFGKGALASVWRPKLLKSHVCHVEDVWESGQKELRIIDVLEPVIGNGRLVVEEELIERDWEQCQKYDPAVRSTYSLFWQLSRITRDRNSLTHDDRLDAVAGSVRHWSEDLSRDADKVQKQIKQQNYNNLIRNPLGNGRALPGFSPARGPNALSRFRRRV